MEYNFALPPELSLASTVLLALILAASGVMSGLSGFGFSAIGAISLSLLSPTLAIPLLMALSTANQLLSIGQLRADMKPLRQAGPNSPVPYLVGGVIGVPIGLWLLAVLPVPTLMTGFGGFLMAYAAYSIAKPNSAWLKVTPNTRSSIVVGGLGGVLGGFTAFPGAPVVMWAGLAQLPKEEIRSIVQPYILTMQIFSLLLLAVFNPASFSAEFWSLLLLLLPVVLPCTLLGITIYKKLSAVNFRRIAFFMLGSSGLGIFVKGVHAVKTFAPAI
jgi:hypothetical protein